MSVDPDRAGKRWSARRIPPDLERAYVDGGWWTDDTLGTTVARTLAAHPASTVAIWSRSRGWQGAYADIDDEARRLVALLQEMGVQSGDPVAFQLPNWREAVVSFAALAMGGYVVVPIVHIYGRKEVAFILEQSRAVAYISPRTWGHVDYGAIVETAAPASLRLHVVVDDAEVPPSSTGPLRVGWAACVERKPAIDLPTVKPDDVAVLAYTSGTTSDPKGVIHDHRTMLSELRHMRDWVTPGKPNLGGSPVTHATGMLGVLGPLTLGESIHLIDRWDPAHALEVMLEAGIASGSGASVFLASLLDHPDFTPAHAAQMTRVGLGGDIGVLDEQGFLTITDRVKDIIIRGGENISAAEVEGALQTLRGVAEIAVVAAPDERLGEHACAIVRMRPGAAPVTLADVKAHLSDAGLARQKWPEAIRVVDDFPRTASGKIRKVDLRAWLRSEPSDSKR